MPLGLAFGQGGLDGCVSGSNSMGIEFESHWEHVFEVTSFSKKFHLCGKTNRRTDRQTDGQTDRQTKILNHVVKTSRSANLRLPRGNNTDGLPSVQIAPTTH